MHSLASIFPTGKMLADYSAIQTVGALQAPFFNSFKGTQK